MPRIVEYEAKGNIQPNSEGYSAYEQAARRTGPLAQQSASDIEKLGRMAAQSAADASKFAYEYDSPFVSLLDKAAKAAAAPTNRGGGGTSRVQGGSGRDLIGTGSGASRDNNVDANLAGQPVKYSGPDITRAAAALAREANQRLNPNGGQTQENNVTVLRGGQADVSDIENSVTVLRGGRPNSAQLNAASDNGVTVIHGSNPYYVKPWNGAGPSATISGPPETSGPHFPIPSMIGTGEPEGPPQSSGPTFIDPNAGPSFGEQVGGWFGSMFSPSEPGPSGSGTIQDVPSSTPSDVVQ